MRFAWILVVILLGPISLAANLFTLYLHRLAIVLDSSFGLPSSSQALLDELPLSVQLGHSETTVFTTVSFGNGR